MLGAVPAFKNKFKIINPKPKFTRILSAGKRVEACFPRCRLSDALRDLLDLGTACRGESLGQGLPQSAGKRCAMSTGQEDDQVLLRDDLAPGRPQLIVYSDDNSVGCAGWCCCAMVCEPGAADRVALSCERRTRTRPSLPLLQTVYSPCRCAGQSGQAVLL